MIRELTNDEILARSLIPFNMAIEALAYLPNYNCAEEAVISELKNHVLVLGNIRYAFIYDELPGTKERVAELIVRLKPLFANNYTAIFDALEEYIALF